MAPLVKALQLSPFFKSKLCVTGQHREMLDQVLGLFEIRPDFDLNLMQSSHGLSDLTQKTLQGMNDVFQTWRPDLLLVHGDTTSSMASALAAYYERIAIGHVEAGLRTGNKYSPWPEEGNRHITGTLADLHFAPSDLARRNLLKENVAAHKIHVTGNTGIDALLMTKRKLDEDEVWRRQIIESLPKFNPDKKLILVTGHRRENFGEGLENICRALLTLSNRTDLEILFPMHLNPDVQKPVRAMLEGKKNIHLLNALEYPVFVYLMAGSHFILTDSGGIQEEAPALGKPVLVMRNCTERPEIIEGGTAQLTGTDHDSIVAGAQNLLENKEMYEYMAQARNPYGNGQATNKILDILEKYRISKYGI